MSTVGLVIFGIVLFAVCYATRCMARGSTRNLPPEIQREVDPYGARR